MRTGSGRSEGGGASETPPSTDGSGWPARRLARAGLLVGGGVLGILVLLYGAAVILLHVLVDPTAVAGWVEPRVEAALNRSVEVDGARIRIFPHLGAEIRGIRVSNLPDFEGPPLAHVEAVRLQVAILPLFRRRIRIDEVRVDEAAIRLAVDAEGRTNYGDLVPESREAPAAEPAAPLDLAIRRVTVRGGSLAWARVADSLRVELSGLEADASVEGSGEGWSGDVRAGADSLVVSRLGPTSELLRLGGPALEGRGRAGPDFGWVELHDGALQVGAAALDLTGRIEDLKEPVRRVDLVLQGREVDVAALLEALPETASGRIPGRASGTLSLDLAVQGTAGPDQLPEVRGSVSLASVAFRGLEGEVLVEELGGRLVIDPDRIEAREVAGTVLGGPFALSGTLASDSLLSFDARLSARPRLGRATALAAMPEDVRLDGRMDVDLELSGGLRALGAARIDGAIEGSGLRLEHPEVGVPASVDEARLVFEGGTVRWSGVEVALGRDRLSTSGSLDGALALLAPTDGTVPRLELDVEGSHLDADAVRPPRGDPSVTYGRIAFAHLGDRTIQDRSAAEWAQEKRLVLPDSLPVAGEARIQLDTLVSEPFRLVDLRARLLFAPGLVEIQEARFGLHGGEVTTRLRLGVGGRRTQPFTLALTAGGVRAADFLEATSPLGRHVTGTLELDLNLAGEVDQRLLPVDVTLAGSGRARIREGGLEENPLTRALVDALSVSALASPSFSEWSAPFEVVAARVRFTEAMLAATRIGQIRYGGAMGLDGSLSLGLRLALPAERLDSLALRRSGTLSAVVGRLAGGEAPVAVGLAVEGTIQDPIIRPRASLATGDLRRALEAEAEKRTEALRDTARARLEEARDTAAARVEAERRRLEERARDEAREAREELEERARRLLRRLGRPRDTLPGDTTSRDTLDRDTLFPDTALPDTLDRDTAGPDTTARDSASYPLY